MIIEEIGGYTFGRGQLTGTYLTGPLAGQTIYFGDVEVERTFTPGDEFKRYSATSGDKLLAYHDVDGSEIGGTITFYQWNEVARDIAAMAHKTPRDQVAQMDLMFTVPAIVGNRIPLEKFDVTDVIVSDGAEGGPVVYDEGVHYQVSNDGKTPAVVTILAIPDGAGTDTVVTFDAPAKKLSARYLLTQSKFEMRLMFSERMKSDNPTPPSTTVMERVSVVLDGNISMANSNAELKTATAKFTALADGTKPAGQQLGYILYPEADAA